MPNVNDIMIARFVAKLGGEPVMNSLGFAIVNPEATWAQQTQRLADEIESITAFQAGGGAWATGLSVQYKATALQIADVSPSTQAMAAYTSGSVGTIVDEDALPPNDSLCVTIRSEFKGPGSRGRIYLTGFAESAQNAGYWESGTQDYAQALMDAFLTTFGELGAAGHRWCIIHKTSNGGVKGAPVVPLVPPEIKPVMGFTVQNRVASIGRRAVGRRVHRARTA